MLDHAQLLGNHVELFADFHAELDQCMPVVAAETLGFRKFVPPDLAGQTGVKRLAVAALFACMRTDLRFGCIFLGRCRIRAKRLSFVEQPELFRVPYFALCAKQLTPVGTQPFLGQVPFRAHQTQHATGFFVLALKGGIRLAHGE